MANEQRGTQKALYGLSAFLKLTCNIWTPVQRVTASVACCHGNGLPGGGPTRGWQVGTTGGGGGRKVVG